jgi:hypothetical protein
VAVLIDQAFLEIEPVESDMVLQHIGTAVPVHVNFAISNTERVGRELRAALLRHQKAVQLIRQEVHTPCETHLRVRSRHCCSPAKWRCKSPICRAEPKAGCAPSTNWQKRFA